MLSLFDMASKNRISLKEINSRPARHVLTIVRDFKRDTPVHIEKLLAKHPDVDINEADNDEGRTSLHFCAQRNHINMARYLIRRGAFVNTAADDRYAGWTPLHVAVLYGHFEMIKLLMIEGYADYRIECQRKETPFQLAERYDRYDMVDYFCWWPNLCARVRIAWMLLCQSRDVQRKLPEHCRLLVEQCL